MNRACAYCQVSIDHMGKKAIYCSNRCRGRASHYRNYVPHPKVWDDTRGEPCLVTGCGRRRATTGFCNRHAHRHKRYGLTAEEMAALDAGVPCAICGEAAAHVDHDHTSGRVRGYLCRACNLGVGYFKDSPTLLRGAVAYLALGG